ncbi:MAG: PASTA domain-containing protein [Bacteroidetes bacterium]|nr:PASTA domain-containing protein [Cryomorphaceae bacterium]MBL6677211.1 PASTA domain-containing protein [Flavobacteriaceae bacterium]MDA0330528.1 PASTA domain-containing protein [Bacteroidota bacterium]MDA0885000.1 PASTA domain-containing protein [Bacteroidota bacterium]MDA1225437.1 PASTA domain-containing protein [Bacteroidota bacterium]
MKIWDQFKSKSLTKQIFLMVSIVIFVFFLVYNSLMIYTKHNKYIEVPNLLGLNLDEAINILKKNKLKYEVLDSSKFFVEIPNYSIISQIPLESELVKKNRKIYLNVNPRNFQKVSLPNVIQITKRNAESILTALGFQVLEYNYVDDIGKDMVLDVLYDGEKIVPGQKIPMNSGLSLILGNGKR